ncbi:MAG: trypsin-like peptidase domain-containing protein, partial [Planctomycetes bacterium]|nr:trypsin-like peptidase domain-containing protein [Planctomycetota bacterium]
MSDSSFSRLLRDRDAIAELLERTASGAGLRGLDELGVEPTHLHRALESGAGGLESTRGGGGTASHDGLEAIVRLHARPSLLVVDGRIDLTDGQVWRRRLAPYTAVLERAMQSVGRVDLYDDDSFDWVGTAWVVAENTVVTNRHVVEAFGKKDGERWVFVQKSAPRAVSADVDFVAEHGCATVNKVRVAGIRWVWHGPGPSADLALMELEGSGIPDPIPLSEHDGDQDRFIAVVGYPARDSRNEDAAMARIFDNLYGIKRFAPGQITNATDAMRFEHDCSTLGGNSGSVVLDVETGHAIGLHFGGTFKKANFAVRASVVRDALSRSKVKVAVPAKAGVAAAEPAAPGGTVAEVAGAATRHNVDEQTGSTDTAAMPALVDGLAAAMQSARRTVEDAFRAIRDQVGNSEAPLPVAEARRLLTALRDERRDAELVELGALIVAKGQDHPMVCRLLAQGQIEAGDLDGAIANLDRTAAKLARRLAAAADPTQASEALWIRNEQAEVQGLLGRAYKQRYHDAGPTRDDPRTADAERAMACYGETYRAAPIANLWHGINLVALRHHQHRLTRRDSYERDPEADRVAADVLRNLDVVDEIGDTGVWDVATRAEAMLALGRHEDLTAAVDALLLRSDLTPFVVRSFQRQLRQIWQLDEVATPGRLVLPKLARWLAERAGETPPAAPLRAPAKAAVRPEVDDNRAGRRARGVAKIGATFFDGDGSGFLFDPLLIWPEYDGPRNVFLLTNAHVCSPDADPLAGDGPLHPRAARFAFLGPKGRIDRQIMVAYCEPLWSSPPNELDATLLLLDGGPTAQPYPLRQGEVKPG